MTNSKSCKKVLSFVLALCVLVVSVTVGTSNKKVFAATNEVSQMSADSHVWFSYAGRTAYAVTVNVKVKNIAYEKKVTIHGKNALTGEWFDVPAEYAYQINDEYEVWTAKPVSYSSDFEYAIKYEVAGQTYWDNNFGHNYIASATLY